MVRPKSNGPNTSTANIGFEAKSWLTADKLRNNMDAAEPAGPSVRVRLRRDDQEAAGERGYAMTDSFDIQNCFAALSPSGPHPLRGAGWLLSLCSPAGCLRKAISAALRFAVLGPAFGISLIRRAPIEADLVDCMVALPGQLFYSTHILMMFQKAA